MCECLAYDDGSMHLCEACAGMWEEYLAMCEVEGGVITEVECKERCWDAWNKILAGYIENDVWASEFSREKFDDWYRENYEEPPF